MTLKDMNRVGIWAILVLASSVLSCSDAESPVGAGDDPAPVEGRIEISGPSVLPERSDAQYSAVVFDADGSEMRSAAVSWTVSTAVRGEIDQTGRLTARRAGTLSVRASSQGLSSEFLVTIETVPLLSVLLTSPRDTLQIGDEITVGAVLTDILDRDFVPDSGLAWGFNPRLAIVTPGETLLLDPRTARMLALSPGDFLLSAGYFGVKSNSVRIVVLGGAVASIVLSQPNPIAAGESTLISADAFDDQGRLLTYEAVSWTSSNKVVATVDHEGRVTGHQAGTSTISATAGGVTTSVEISVSAASPARLEVPSDTLDMVIGESRQISVQVIGSDGRVMNDPPLTFSSSSPDVFSVSDEGRVVGLSLGGGQAIVTSGSLSASIQVYVSRPVARIDVSPDTATVLRADSIVITAIPYDSSGVRIRGRHIDWSVQGNGSLSCRRASRFRECTSDQWLKAIQPGEVTVQARMGSIVGSATVRFVPRPLSRIQIFDSSGDIVLGSTRRFFVRPLDDLGSTFGLSAAGTEWRMLDTAIATIDPAGVARGLRRGQTTVVAQLGGFADSVAVTVERLRPVGFVRIVADPLNLGLGRNRFARGEVFDRSGAPIHDLTPTWELADSTVVTLQDGGGGVILSPVRAGPSRLILDFDGIRDSVPVIVQPYQVDSVRVSPWTQGIPVDSILDLKIEVFHSGGATPDRFARPWFKAINESVARFDTVTHRLETLQRGDVRVGAFFGGVEGEGHYFVEGKAAEFAFAVDSVGLILGVPFRDSRNVGLSIRDRDGFPVFYRRPTVWSSNSAIVSVAAGSSIRVWAQAIGSAWIHAEMDGQRDSVLVSVTGPMGGSSPASINDSVDLPSDSGWTGWIPSVSTGPATSDRRQSQSRPWWPTASSISAFRLRDTLSLAALRCSVPTAPLT